MKREKPGWEAIRGRGGTRCNGREGEVSEGEGETTADSRKEIRGRNGRQREVEGGGSASGVAPG